MKLLNNNSSPTSPNKFRDRIINFQKKFQEQFNQTTYKKNTSIDPGDIFRALNCYIILTQSSPTKKNEEKYRSMIYNGSGLAQILENIELEVETDGIFENKNSKYDQTVNKLKTLLKIYIKAIKSVPCYDSKTDTKELQTARQLRASDTPIPNTDTPSNWCNCLTSIAFFLIILAYLLLEITIRTPYSKI